MNDKKTTDTHEHEASTNSSDLDSGTEDSSVSKPKRSGDIVLVVVLIILIGTFFGIFFLVRVTAPAEPTIDDLHVLNMEGKLEESQGYIFRSYSFVNYDDQWYVLLQSPTGNTEYNLGFRFGPRDVEDVDVSGRIALSQVSSADQFYVTFNPTGRDLSHVALTIADLDTHLINSFHKMPIAACDRNETEACTGRPIVTCENADDIPVFYVKESNTSRVVYDGMCIVIEGSGLDLVKNMNYVLYNFYDVIPFRLDG